MDEVLSEKELKRIHLIRDQYIEGQTPVIISTFFKGAFEVSPWATQAKSKGEVEKDKTEKETQPNGSTIGTIDLEKTLSYDEFEENKESSMDEYITVAISPPNHIKEE